MSQPAPLSSHSQYAELEQQLNDLSSRASDLFARLHSHQLNLRPEPDRWSVAECVEHLNLFSEKFIPIIAAACDVNEERSEHHGPFKMDLIGRVLKVALEPPARLRTNTTRNFEPTIIEPVDELLPRFVRLQQELIAQIRSSRGLDLTHVKIVSPVSSRIRYNLFSYFHIIAAHQRRHLWQAEQTLSEIVRN